MVRRDMLDWWGGWYQMPRWGMKASHDLRNSWVENILRKQQWEQRHGSFATTLTCHVCSRLQHFLADTVSAQLENSSAQLVWCSAQLENSSAQLVWRSTLLVLCSTHTALQLNHLPNSRRAARHVLLNVVSVQLLLTSRWLEFKLHE